MQVIKTIDSYFYKELGLQLRNIRQEQRLTLNEISKKTGYSRPLIDRWELGITKIKPSQFERICNVLSIPTMLKVDVQIGL
ncbi:MAG: helix-turn-helix domain-containing protein [Firmicutes bacterium]|nr:helix-turn-helix domain-containing protein [Bacillota bacterium]